MRILHRYLLRELLYSLIATTIVLFALMSMVFFSMKATQAGTANLSVRALFLLVGCAIANRLDILVSLATLTAVVWTYGRTTHEGEITAMRGAGVGMRGIVMPAVLLGAVMTIALAFAQDRLVPVSHYKQMVIGKRQLAENLEALLLDESKDIRDRKFKVRWSTTAKDKDDYIVLEDVVVSEDAGEGRPPRVTRAKRATPTINPQTGDLKLALQEMVVGQTIAAEGSIVHLDLRAISEEPPAPKRIEDLTYEELLTASKRSTGKAARKYEAEFHRRVAMSFAPFFFAFFGATFGILFRIANRAVIFGAAFLCVLLLDYAPVLIGIEAATRGALPAWIATWIGNILVFVTGIVGYGKARRR